MESPRILGSLRGPSGPKSRLQHVAHQSQEVRASPFEKRCLSMHIYLPSQTAKAQTPDIQGLRKTIHVHMDDKWYQWTFCGYPESFPSPHCKPGKSNQTNAADVLSSFWRSQRLSMFANFWRSFQGPYIYTYSCIYMYTSAGPSVKGSPGCEASSLSCVLVLRLNEITLQRWFFVFSQLTSWFFRITLCLHVWWCILVGWISGSWILVVGPGTRQLLPTGRVPRIWSDSRIAIKSHNISSYSPGQQTSWKLVPRQLKIMNMWNGQPIPKSSWVTPGSTWDRDINRGPPTCEAHKVRMAM